MVASLVRIGESQRMSSEILEDRRYLGRDGLLLRRKKIDQNINIARTNLVCELENVDHPTIPKDATILVIHF